VKRTTVCLHEEQANALRELAALEGRSYADLVREAVGEYLLRRAVEAGARVIEPRRRLSDEEWRSGWDAALQRIRASVDSSATPEEIEAAITAASEEIRQERLARRRASLAWSGGFHLCRDPKDDLILETALVAKARYVVSRDDDVKRDLDLIRYLRANGIETLSVAQFLDLLEEQSG
jgi:predicted nucleic acid-binding protein